MSTPPAEPTSPKYFMYTHNLAKKQGLDGGRDWSYTAVANNEAAGTGWIATITYKGVTAMNETPTAKRITALNEAARKVLVARGDDLTKVPT